MSVRVGILSDTHGMLRPEILEDLKGCDYILHAGDFADESVLDQIRFIGMLYVVRGNSDGPWALQLADRQKFRIEDLEFLLIHDRMKAGADAFGADVVVSGHTHHYSEEVIDGTLWLNPGSCGISRFGEDLSYVIMEIEGRNYVVNRIILPEI